MVWIGGIEGIPDVYTWIGGVVIMAGVGLITVGEYKRSGGCHEEEEKDIDVSKKMRMIEMKIGRDEVSSLSSGDDAETVLLSAESFDEESPFNDDDGPPPVPGEARDDNSLCRSGSSSPSPSLDLSSPSFLHHLPSSLSLWKGKDHQQEASCCHEYSALSAVDDEGEGEGGGGIEEDLL
jgi:hypothetical protein